MLKLQYQYAQENEQTLFALQKQVDHVFAQLKSNQLPHSNLAGWIVPEGNVTDDIINDINSLTNRWHKSKIDTLVICGIGGSYLGARAAINYILNDETNRPYKIVWLGQNLSADYISSQLKQLEKANFAVNVISKTGTTLETCLSFRLVVKLLQKKYKTKWQDRIAVTTGQPGTKLYDFAKKHKLHIFHIPEIMAGRFTVLTPVGLLPMAFMGIKIKDVFSGLKEAAQIYTIQDIKQNIALQYCLFTVLMYKKYPVQLFCDYEPRLTYFNEWLKQLYGESHGKSGTGMWPASCIFTTDLHSLGQFIQEGRKLLFETVLVVKNIPNRLTFPKFSENLDGLDFLVGREITYIQNKLIDAVSAAHSIDGKTPVMTIEISAFNEKSFAHLVYFFFIAVSISAYILKIDPFDNTGVDIYKRRALSLLNK